MHLCGASAGALVAISRQLRRARAEERKVVVVEAARHGDRDEVSGTIVRLNYALHGEVNGYHLDDGTFAHVKPEGAKKYKLRVGDQVKANGSLRAGSGATVLEVRALEKLGARGEKRAEA